MTHARHIGAIILMTCSAATALGQPAEPPTTEPPTPPVAPELPPAPAPDVAPPAPPPATPPVVAEPAPQPLPAGPEDKKPEAPHGEKKKTPWYEKINVRGYTQFRYNRLPSRYENDDFINQQGDRSIGEKGGASIRRARLILFGDVHDYVSIYLQPDFASSISSQGGVAILRDWYADLFLDKEKQFRFRVGQSKVPYGFENLQSSQNRLPLDRNDALNSAVKDERDLGAFFYWTPPKYRRWFKQFVDENMKGSGDYGIVGFGVYNGQTANAPTDGDLHVIGRVSVPFQIGKQFFEVGGGGFYGKYTVSTPGSGFRVAGATSDTPIPKLVDKRVHATVVVYPQPLGFVAEYTAGRNPSLGGSDTNDTVIDSRWLQGGYAQLFYKFDRPFGMVAMIPFARGTYYEGGKKHITNAPRYEIKELEVGLETQVHKALEIVLAYQIARRTRDEAPYTQEYGETTRLQVQVNY